MDKRNTTQDKPLFEKIEAEELRRLRKNDELLDVLLLETSEIINYPLSEVVADVSKLHELANHGRRCQVSTVKELGAGQQLETSELLLQDFNNGLLGIHRLFQAMAVLERFYFRYEANKE